MKSVLRIIVLLATILTASSEFSDKCISASDGTTFKHSESTHSIFVCLSHKLYEVYCLDNYYYDETNQVCVLSTEIIDTTGKSSTNDNICENITEPVVIPSERGCQYFYFCINGVPLIASCPSGFLFDPLKLNCYPEENVDCNPTTTVTFTTSTVKYTTLETTESTEDLNFCNGVPNGELFSNPESCSHFFICMNNIPVPGTCSRGYYFDIVRRGCFPPEEVECIHITTTTQIPTVSTTETPQNKICDGIPDFQLVDNPSSCDAFYYCFNGTAFGGICLPPLLFNPILRICDLPENVYCPSETPTTTTESTTESTTEYNDICFRVPNFTLINDPRKCADYFVCLNEQSIPLSCPDGFYFDPILLFCASSETVNCTDSFETTTSTDISSTVEPTTSDQTTSTTEESSTTTAEPLTTTEPSTSDQTTSTTEEPSTTTVNCTDGFETTTSTDISSTAEPTTSDQTTSTTEEPSTTTAEPLTTAEPTTSDQTTSTTEEPSTTTAEPLTTTTGSTTTARPIPNSCPSSGVISIPDQQRCSRFRLCVSGIEFELACPADKHFVFSTGRCEPREIANCQIQLPDCGLVTPTPHFLPNPQYCNRFFICYAGILTPLECQQGFHFNIELNQCSIPALANCEAV